MTETADLLLRELPFLRRYARALTGTQSRGDDLVRVCVESLLESDAQVDPGNARVDIFRAFHRVWRVLQSPGSTGGGGADDARSGIALDSLPAIERQALLLVSLEQFTYAEVAAILDVDEARARDLFTHAREEIRRQASVPVLIIEDESLIAMDIQRIVEEMGHTVCGIAARESEAVAAAEAGSPALILADIQLKDGDSGIAAVQQILQSYTVPVVFVTGYPERLLTGKTLEPTFLVTKPFEPETLKVAIGQALST